MGGHRMSSTQPGTQNHLGLPTSLDASKPENLRSGIEARDTALENIPHEAEQELHTSSTTPSGGNASAIDLDSKTNPVPDPTDSTNPTNPNDGHSTQIPPSTTAGPVPLSISAPGPIQGTQAPSTVPMSPSVPDYGDISSDPLDTPVDITTFRVLMGIPGAHTAIPPPTVKYHPFIPKFVRQCLWPHDPEQPTSIYFSIISQERSSKRDYRIYDMLVYLCLFAQLALSATLVILAALPAPHHITLAILGAVNGVIAGILSLVKGQGMPMRLLKYGDALRKIREEVEWYDRELRSRSRVVTMRDCQNLRDKYDGVRDDEIRNSPDVWATGGTIAGMTSPTAPAGGPSGAKSRAPTMPLTMGGGAGGGGVPTKV